MILECGNIIISCADSTFFQSNLNELGYSQCDIEVSSSEKKYSLSIRIYNDLSFKERLQAITIQCLSRIAYNPDKTDLCFLNHIPYETRIKDYDGGYWERLLDESKQISLDNDMTDMIVGRGFVV